MKAPPLLNKSLFCRPGPETLLKRDSIYLEEHLQTTAPIVLSTVEVRFPVATSYLDGGYLYICIENSLIKNVLKSFDGHEEFFTEVSNIFANSQKIVTMASPKIEICFWVLESEINLFWVISQEQHCNKIL